MTALFKKNILLVVVVLVSAVLAVGLGAAAWDINFWPTDTEAYYFDAAVSLKNLDYVSQIHESLDEDYIKWLHGKEMYIVLASWMQRILADTQTLRPFLIVCILAVFFSSIFIFLVARKFWQEKIAFILYFLFVSCFWPYLYVLFTKHQPIGLFFFLLSIVLFNSGKNIYVQGLFYFLSGLSICSALFASSVAALYVPYYGVFFLCAQHKKGTKIFSFKFWIDVLLIILGITAAFIYFNYPKVIYNVKAYWEYVNISGEYNHFFYNQPVLQQWIDSNIAQTRGGWLFIFKYFLFIMPVLFPLYILSNGYLLFEVFRNFKDRRFVFITAVIILLGISSPVLAEVKGVAQYGANYFTFIVGIFLVIGYALYLFERECRQKIPQKNIMVVAAAVLLSHLVVNLYYFLYDVYPTRMATSFLAKEIKRLPEDKVYTYQKTPYTFYIDEQLKRKAPQEVGRFIPISNLSEAKTGFILVPPISKDSVYMAAHGDYLDFDQDIFLSSLVEKDILDDYTIKSFPTLTASKIWPLEEEILAYRYLILNQWPEDMKSKGHVRLLDARRLQEDLRQNMPSRDIIHLAKDNVRNIGAKNKMYAYKGYAGILKTPTALYGFAARMYKVGDPQDELIAYVFKLDKDQPVWVAYGENYKSEPLSAKNITNSPEGSLAVFKFSEPLKEHQGPYRIVIYRNGDNDDENYYRLYTGFQKIIGKNM